MIEIVVDDDEPAATVAAPMDTTVPVLAPPVPPSSKTHSRGRSFTERDRDNGFASRFTKATERLRSASRGRKEAGASRMRSPADGSGPVPPYESVPPPGYL